MPEPTSFDPSTGDDTSTGDAADPSDGTGDTRTFRLRCTDCSFETTVEGDSRDALDVADAHQAEHGEPLADHFVNFTAVDT